MPSNQIPPISPYWVSNSDKLGIHVIDIAFRESPDCERSFNPFPGPPMGEIIGMVPVQLGVIEEEL